MPIRKFERIFVDGRYTGQHACTVECSMCGKQICFDTFYSFGGLHHPPEVEQNGFVKAITPDGYAYICKDHVKGYDHIDTNYWKREDMSNVISFDAEKVSRFIEQALAGFINDPADSDFQRGYLAALLTTYEEGLGKGAAADTTNEQGSIRGLGDGRLTILHDMVKETCK